MILVMGVVSAQAEGVRIQDLGRFSGWQSNALVGYGIVTGLSGSGDSPRSQVTRQALSNVLSRLGANIQAADLQSRNVAAVIVTATLPPLADVGDKIDVTVTSMGDARSLAGGTLLMAPLLGPDQRDYALAQGALVVGGYNFKDNFNLSQKNYPTTGVIANGATVERPVDANLVDANGRLKFVLKDPDFTTAQRITDALNQSLGANTANTKTADAVEIDPAGRDVNRLIASIENIEVVPGQPARVVVNERSGTVVAGGGVRISNVVIAQGDIKVSITTDNQAIQPYIFAGRGGRARDLIVTNSTLDVSEGTDDAVVRLANTSVADLVNALNQAKIDTRRTIAILEAIKAAGALHADIVVQ
jgi:flagellar P-ring protein precursor FlgI